MSRAKSLFNISSHTSFRRIFRRSTLQTKCATYAEIRAWVKEHYGLHVSNLAISWTKDLCGLAKTREKDRKGAGGPYAAELTPEKEAAIREAFIRFGLIEK